MSSGPQQGGSLPFGNFSFYSSSQLLSHPHSRILLHWWLHPVMTSSLQQQYYQTQAHTNTVDATCSCNEFTCTSFPLFVPIISPLEMGH